MEEKQAHSCELCEDGLMIGKYQWNGHHLCRMHYIEMHRTAVINEAARQAAEDEMQDAVQRLMDRFLN